LVKALQLGCPRAVESAVRIVSRGRNVETSLEALERAKLRPIAAEQAEQDALRDSYVGIAGACSDVGLVSESLIPTVASSELKRSRHCRTIDLFGIKTGAIVGNSVGKAVWFSPTRH
jgi:hypothetical protein